MHISIHTTEKLRAAWNQASTPSEEFWWVSIKSQGDSISGSGEIIIYCDSETVAKAICDAINLRDPKPTEVELKDIEHVNSSIVDDDELPF